MVTCTGCAPPRTPQATSRDNNDNAILAFWNVRTRTLSPPVNLQAETLTSVAFSPDGRTLATGEDGGTVTLWNVSYLQDALSLLCAQQGGSITAGQWASSVPAGVPYHDACRS